VLHQTDLPSLVRGWRSTYSVPENVIIDAVLGFDAATFGPEWIGGEKCDNCSAFPMMPIDPDYPSLTVHLKSHPHGSMKKRGYNDCSSVCEILKRCSINLTSSATDGDGGNCDDEKYLFGLYARYLELPPDSLCTVMFESECNITWRVADILHCLKSQRCRLVNCLALPPNGETLNAAKLNQTLQLRSPS
jgi:hypothetical protein